MRKIVNIILTGNLCILFASLTVIGMIAAFIYKFFTALTVFRIIIAIL